MTLVLDATISGAGSNAYLDETAADAILAGVPNASAWSVAASAPRQLALVYATQLLEALAYQGVKATVAQALQWPRGSVLDPDYGLDAQNIGYQLGGNWGIYLDYAKIPKRLQRACAMLALEILRAGTADIWGADSTLEVKRKKVDVIETEYVDRGQRRVGLRALPSVWREVFPLTLAATPRSVERA